MKTKRTQRARAVPPTTKTVSKVKKETKPKASPKTTPKAKPKTKSKAACPWAGVKLEVCVIASDDEAAGRAPTQRQEHKLSAKTAQPWPLPNDGTSTYAAPSKTKWLTISGDQHVDIRMHYDLDKALVKQEYFIRPAATQFDWDRFGVKDVDVGELFETEMENGTKLTFEARATKKKDEVQCRLHEAVVQTPDRPSYMESLGKGDDDGDGDY